MEHSPKTINLCNLESNDQVGTDERHSNLNFFKNVLLQKQFTVFNSGKYETLLGT